MTPPESRSAQGDGPLSSEAVESHTAVETPESPAESAQPPADEETTAALPDESQADEQPVECPEERRRAALGSLLDEFMEQTAAAHESDPVPHFLELGGRPVELGLWERSVIKKSRDSRNKKAGNALALLAESVACRASCASVLERIEHGPLPSAAELPNFQARMVTEVAVGIVLQERLQQEVDRRIAEGQLAEAKALQGFKSNLVQCITALREVVGPDEVERAQLRALELGGTDRVKADDDSAAAWTSDEKTDPPAWTTFKRRESELPPWLTEGEAPEAESAESEATPSTRRRNLLGPMLLVLAFLLVVYGVVMLPRALRTQLPVLSVDMFAHLEAVQQINARPPSLFVRLDKKAWDAGSAQYRLELVEEIGRIAGEWGYSGAHVMTDDGTTVGQWLSNTGVRVIPRPATSS